MSYYKRPTSRYKFLILFLIIAVILIFSLYSLVFNNKSSTSQVIEDKFKHIIEKTVQDYIKNNPQILVDAIEEMQQREQVNRQKMIDDSVKNNREKLETPHNSAFLGDVQAKNKLVYFYDYNCSYCQQSSNVLHKLYQDNKEKVQIIFRNIPILGKKSEQISQIAAVVAKYKPEKYSEFHFDLINDPVKNRDKAIKYAQKYGIDKKLLESYIKSNQANNFIIYNFELAKSVSFQGTPYLIVNGEIYKQEITLNNLDQKLLK